MTQDDMPIRVAALYKFTPFGDLAGLRAALEQCCSDAAVKGTLLLAPEGINGTIAGTDDGIEMVAATYSRAARLRRSVDQGFARRGHAFLQDEGSD